MTKNDGKEEYKFVIAILAGTISFLLTSFNYIQNTAINAVEYISLSVLISLALMILIGFIIYFIFKGFSIVPVGNYSEIFDAAASKIYLLNFCIFTFFLMIILFVLLIFNSVQMDNNSTVEYIFKLVLVAIIIPFAVILLSNLRIRVYHFFVMEALKISLKRNIIILLCIAFIWIFLSAFLLTSSYQGTIKLDMDKMYYKSDKQIPVLMEITGPKVSFTVILSKDKSNDLIEIWRIQNFGPKYFTDFKVNSFTSNDSLVASSLGNGKFNIFINTTNLTTGYYQIKILRQKVDKSYETGFYLLDDKNEPINRINKLKDERNLTIQNNIILEHPADASNL